MKPKTRTLQWVCILIVVAFSTAWTQSSQAAIPFTHTTDLVTAAPSSRGVAAADFNRDGVPDLVLTGSEDATIHGSVSVFLGNGDGTFPAGTTYPLAYGALAVAAGDINSDTFPDLAVGTIANMVLLLGNGDGSFASATELESQGTAFVSFADLNADGHPDFVASTAYSVLIRLGNGDGTFRPAIDVRFPDCVYGKVLHGDFNGDARTDLAVIRCTDVVSVLLGNGDGTFQSPVDYRVTHGPSAGDVGDLNSDGRLDLAIVGSESSTVFMLMGNGDGTFTPGATIATGVYPIEAALGDLNSDHIPDLTVATYFGSTLEVSAGRGDGTFEPKIGYPTAFSPSLALGDWDRDGLLDIAASNWGGALPGSQISLFRNTPGVLVGASPVVAAPSTVTGNVGSLIAFNVSAVDPDGDPISSLRAIQLLDRGGLPDGATFTPDATNTSGTFRWTPDFSQGGRSYDVAFVAQNALSASVRTSIFVNNASNRPPALAPVANMTADEGATADQSITGTDPDGDALTFSKVAGPTYMTVTTVTPGTGTGTGNIHLAPGFLDAGTALATVRASDGTLSNDKSLTITVNDVAGPPILAAIANMTVDAGATADQGISATDPDGDAITFASSGPGFMTRTDNAQVGNTRTGNIHLAPPLGTTGTFQASVTATANSQLDDQTFLITVRINNPPTLAQPADMSVDEGATADQAITATDPDGDALVFSKVAGPTYMVVTTTNATTGNIRLAPGFTNAGTAPATVRASDGRLTNDRSFTITVNNVDGPPVLAAIANMVVAPGATADQGISATDPDGDAIMFTSSGLAFMTLTSNAQVGNTRTGNIHLAPPLGTSGTFPASVTATANGQFDDQTFVITVSVNRAPTLNAIANMTVQEGATADQVITGSDPDGDALTFTKAAGPTFMTVLTMNATTGNIHLAPGFSDAGTARATVTATDSGSPPLSSSRSFTITSGFFNSRPVLNAIANMTVNEGATADQLITGSDPDGNALTFTKAAGPTFVTVLTINATTGNIHLAPGFTDAGMAGATVTVSDGRGGTDSKSFTITVNSVNRAPTLNQPANMIVAPGTTADQVITGSDPDGDALTFTKAAGPTFVTVTTTNATTGNVHAAPGFSDASQPYVVTVTTTDNGTPPLSNSKSFTVTVHGPSRAPVLNAIANMTVNEGATADQVVTGTDADGDPLTFSKTAGPMFMTVTTTSATTGNVHLAPGFSDAGTYGATVMASDGTGGTDSKSFTITVNNVNRCPIANPGGPYAIVIGVPVSFDGTGSLDTDGDPLVFAWDFGDGSTGVGPTPVHVYADAGVFTVTLTVTDNGTPPCSGTATTTTTILLSCSAMVSNGYDVIRLNSGRPSWFAFVEPASGCYSNTDVVLSSFVLKYSGRQIPADGSKTFIESDKNGDGTQEIRVGFLKPGLRTLFAGLPNGHNLVEVTIEANLVTGGRLQGTTQVDVFVSSSSTAATVAPNPLNPEATLTFTTARAGFAKAELFDIGGRLVRTILDERSLAAGVHQVRIEGRGQRGESLASGIYFLRGVSADGEFTKTIAILK